MDRLMSEISLRADDTSYDQLSKQHYRKALLVARRKVAKRYNLIQRLYSFETNLPKDLDAESPNDTTDIILPMTNFISEYQVLVNDVSFTKVDRLNANKKDEYVLERDHNRILFNYWFRGENDYVKIYFTSDINKEDFEIEELSPIIPSQYDEEVMQLALVEIAKYGIIKFSKTDKEDKYRNLFSIYGMDEKSLDKELIKNDAWVQMEVYRVY